MALSPLNQRRWRNFCRNRRAFWSLIIFSVLFGLSLFAEIIANDKPILVKYRGEFYTPIFNFYAETEFGGDFQTEAIYRDPEVRCLIDSGGLEDCFDDPEGIIEQIEAGTFQAEGFERGWAIWPPIPYSYNTTVDRPGAAPLPPNAQNWLGTDDTKRDVLARVIYGFRISVLFGFILTVISAIIGITAGAIQGYYGGWIDLIFQRFIEIWVSMPQLYILIILASVIEPNFWWLLGVLLLFSWIGFVGVVRAEFLKTRNFDYVRAARALGVSDQVIIFRHVLPNAMVATMTFMPFTLAGSVTILTSLDFLGIGLPPGSASLGDLLAQGKANLQAPWLGLTGFFVIGTMLTLLIFIGEAVRDAFDPRKLFAAPPAAEVTPDVRPGTTPERAPQGAD